MQVNFNFLTHELDGKVQLRVDGKLIPLTAGSRVEVSVTPNFYRKTERPMLCWLATEASKNKFIYRGSLSLSGTNGLPYLQARKNTVEPAFVSGELGADASDETDEEEVADDAE